MAPQGARWPGTGTHVSSHRGGNCRRFCCDWPVPLVASGTRPQPRLPKSSAGCSERPREAPPPIRLPNPFPSTTRSVPTCFSALTDRPAHYKPAPPRTPLTPQRARPALQSSGARPAAPPGSRPPPLAWQRGSQAPCRRSSSLVFRMESSTHLLFSDRLLRGHRGVLTRMQSTQN